MLYVWQNGNPKMRWITAKRIGVRRVIEEVTISLSHKTDLVTLHIDNGKSGKSKSYQFTTEQWKILIEESP